MHHEKTVSYGLNYCWASCVLSSGEIVLWGKTSDHRYQFKLFDPNGDPTARMIPGVCKHDTSIDIISGFIQDEEHLFISCFLCHEIYVMNLQAPNPNPTLVFSGHFGPMCLGSEASLYTVDRNKADEGEWGSDLYQLDIKGMKLTVKHKLCRIVDMFTNRLCHSGEHGIVILSSFNDKRLCAVSTRYNNVIWDI